MAEIPMATQPDRSFSVLASAGTGKTWQLVSRLTRLLLHGAAPDSILAITFTRKAAGEMQQRLGERLLELLEADDKDLDRILSEMGEACTPELRLRARKLLEQWLTSERSLRTTTFHSFCQELLQRFPLEAGLPPGFELLEQTGFLIDESWDALFAEATRTPDGKLAGALEFLFETLNGLHNTRNALHTFIEHRGDWWAFIQDSNRPVDMAVDYLQQQLETAPGTSPAGSFWHEETRQKLSEFALLLARHTTVKNQEHIQLIEQLLASARETEQAVRELRTVFFTGSGPRKRKSQKAQRKNMGEANEDRFLELHGWFVDTLEQVLEQLARQQTLRLNQAWYLAGQRMLEHYQRIKRERRVLDFADLEWNAYRLLNHPQHSHWVQYKLDQRIDHLLIDEFQDTNPTQWRLILPLLEEMAAGDERMRSLFVVGDAKQSIYRFRRGNPRLLNCASDWMQQHLHSERIHLDHSWRSSSTVLEIVNGIFKSPHMQPLMPDFQDHDTHRRNLWGQVELWPLIEPEEVPPEDQGHEFRNPLLTPRAGLSDRPHYREGLAIAGRIRELIEQRPPVDEGSKAHPVGFNDMLILMRSRTHLSEYEAALRDSGIPYLSLDRGTLLQSLEIRDLEALMAVLMTPQDNLALAQVLRSPIFSAADDALMLLARESSGSWYERLQALTRTAEPEPSLLRACRLLEGWISLAGRIPIHDLLERIFHESNLLARYRAAFPATQVNRVQANLTRFIELALEVDAGRYPTLPRFLERLSQLRNLEKEGPSQATPQDEDGERVCLLTIHAAKGLEAPVVFLVDAANQGNSPPGYKPLVRWPAEADRPADFMLLGKTEQRDRISASRYQLEQEEEQRESANLLYVALTRAQHMLIISGCAPARSRRNLGWYGQISTALCEQPPATEPWIRAHGEIPAATAGTGKKENVAVQVDPRLCKPFRYHPRWKEIAPSHAVDDQEAQGGDRVGRVRGLAIHRMLQLACEAGPHLPKADGLVRRVARELQWSPDDSLMHHCWQEVELLLHKPELQWLFKPGTDTRAWNEAPIQYRHQDKTVYGIVDRLLVNQETATLIDYKSHRILDTAQIGQLAQHYQPQMDLYREGIRKLWPERTVKTILLFTDGGTLVEVS